MESFHNQTPDRDPATSELEVAGSIDAFTSLDEIASDLDWSDVLADTWGIPAPDQETQPAPDQSRSLLTWLKTALFR